MSDLVDLKRAFNEKRLAAVHVDLQNCYFREETMAAYPAANDLAAVLRAREVPNHWVAYTRDWSVRTPLQFSQKYTNTALDLHRAIDIAAGEKIFEKAGQGAFDHADAPLCRTLRADGTRALVVDGVIHSACVAQTIAGAMTKGLQVFAAIDATDCHIADHAMWRHWILHTLQDPSRAHLLTVTTSHAIRRALSPAL